MTNGEAMKQLGLTDEDLAVFICFDPNVMMNKLFMELKLKNGKKLNVLNTEIDQAFFACGDLYHGSGLRWMSKSTLCSMLREYWKKKDICPALQPLMIGD